MKRMDHGAVAVSGVSELPDMGLTSKISAVAQPGADSAYARYGKRLCDIVFVLLGLPIVLPIVLVFAAALWIEGGQPFYRQKRLGRGGRVFKILKLRTMVRDADAALEAHLRADAALRKEWDETQKLKQDPRVTRVGHLLRAASLDELPQLWNVLVGEMSLVGPRPMMVQQLALYGPTDNYYAMRPGITGLWQVGERNETTFAARAKFDATYRADLSLEADLKIILRTFPVVLQQTGY